MDFADFTSQAEFQEAGKDSGDSGQHNPFDPSVVSTHDQQKSAYFNATANHQISCEIKPRLTKEQHDVLEAHYQKQNKPNTSTKKGFAEALSVSLDKINNWFQNRRAKSKQDAKKQAGAFNLYHAQQQATQLNFSSDSDTSPAFPSSEYFTMMQQCATDDQVPDEPSRGFDLSQPRSFHDGAHLKSASFPIGAVDAVPYTNGGGLLQATPDMFDSPQEINRRTLTQEQFDAFTQNGGIMHPADLPNLAQQAVSADQEDVLYQLFPDSRGGDFKALNPLAFHHNAGAPSSDSDSLVPSIISDASTFPSSGGMQEHAGLSVSGSERAGSRSSSLSSAYQSDSFPQMQPPRPPLALATTTSQWQPGQSVPVDLNALSQEFRQAAQGRGSPKLQATHEQPLAWPTDEAFVRRDSQTTLLTQHMSSVDIHTPQPPHTATFKSPAPPSSIALRRQRPRPAALGLASLRSQSYSAAGQPNSPGQTAQQGNSTSGQPLRRIRSTNVVNGVTQGRVQKPLPGSAQRSPLAWTFPDSVNSPKAARCTSFQQASGSLAPPTPMSPRDFSRPDMPRPMANWQTASANVSRQPSISESDLENVVPMVPSTSAPPQNFSSPPHTPMYHQQHFVQQRIGNPVITENTPPQSAPASQQSFGAGSYAPQPPPAQPPTQLFVTSLPQQFMSVQVPEQPHPAPTLAYPPSQPYMLPVTTRSAETAMQFANGVPLVNAQGQLQMGFPPQFPFIQPPAQPPSQTHAPPPQAPGATSSSGQFSQFSIVEVPPGMQGPAQLTKQALQPAMEFVAHEYSPPQDAKAAAVPPRKPVDTGPKNYTFANHGPEHFENGKKGAKGSAAASDTSESSTNGSTTG